MRITESQLRRIIREAFTSQSPWIVIANYSRGRGTSIYPYDDSIELYSRAEAEEIAKKKNSEKPAWTMGPSNRPHYHAEDVVEAMSDKNDWLASDSLSALKNYLVKNNMEHLLPQHDYETNYKDNYYDED